MQTCDADAAQLLRCVLNWQLAHDDCRQIRSTIYKLIVETP